MAVPMMEIGIWDPTRTECKFPILRLVIQAPIIPLITLQFMRFPKPPSSLPTADSLLVDYDALIEAIETVTLIDKVELEYLAGPAN